MDATIVITTRNRRDLTLRAIESCLAQRAVAIEILVYDDASTDGTTEVVQAAFPQVRVQRNEERVGYLRNRNRGFQDASYDIVVSIDDDAYFTHEDTLRHVLRMFDDAPQVAAVAIPFIEPSSKYSRGSSPRIRGGTRLRQYIGCAHALRRRLAIEFGGYPELLVHQGEERDLCIRLLDAGYEIVAAECSPIFHEHSPVRDSYRLDYYGYRNTLFFHWMRTPHPWCFPYMAVATVNLLRHDFSLEKLPTRLRAIASGWAGVRHWARRAPVSSRVFRRFRRMPRPSPAAPSCLEGAGCVRHPDSIRP